MEYKVYGNAEQFYAVDEAIRAAQFIRNKCVRFWMNSRGAGKHDLNAYSAMLAKEFPFAGKLNSMARQAAERAWSATARFCAACKQATPGKKPYPRFKKNFWSVEYKTSGWKLAEDLKRIAFTDGNGIGTLKLKGTRHLSFFALDQIKRVRLIRRADGYYVQFCVAAERCESIAPSQSYFGLDMGLESFYTDSPGGTRPRTRVSSARRKPGSNVSSAP